MEDQVSSLISQALKIVEETSPPDDLREVAFAKAVDLLSSARVDAGGAIATPNNVQPTQRTDTGDAMTRIAKRLGVTYDEAAAVYYLHDDALELQLSRSWLAKGKAGATRQIATLVVAGRVAAGLDEDSTPTEMVREVVRHHGVLDDANFQTTVKEMTDVFYVRGKGRQRTLRILQPGMEAAAAIIRSFVGADA